MENQQTFQEQLAELASIFQGSKNGILARRAHTTTESVRRTFKSKATCFADLTEMQQRIINEAINYLECCNQAQQRIPAVLK